MLLGLNSKGNNKFWLAKISSHGLVAVVVTVVSTSCVQIISAQKCVISHFCSIYAAYNASCVTTTVINALFWRLSTLFYANVHFLRKSTLFTREYTFLRKVHDFHGVGVHGDGAGHSGRRAVLGAQAGGVRALARVVLLLHQVVPGPDR